MTKKSQIYKCGICGNIVEVLHEGAGDLVCCGEKMILHSENTFDAAQEKHVPVIDGNQVKVGEIPHPMEKEHFIEWIEATSKSGEVAKVFLSPGDSPEAEFCFEVKSAREYCNVHGLWKSS